MEKEQTDPEEHLIALLAELKMEATPEADFEERFLYDFHEKIAQQAVCRPARLLLWEHVMQMLSNIGKRKIAYGASAIGLGAFAIGFFSWPGAENDPIAVPVAAAAEGLEHSMASLKPGTAKEYTCITVSKGQPSRHFSNDRIALQNVGRFFARQGDDASLELDSSLPVEMGLSSDQASFPSWSIYPAP